MDILELLAQMEQFGASDLHLKVGAPPVFRVNGELRADDSAAPLSSDDARAAFAALTTEAQRSLFMERLEFDFSFQAQTPSRYRINASIQQGEIGLAIRRIPLSIPPLASLGLPAICGELVGRRQGLILVTGPTGSGKSTTLAAMIDHLNETASRRIITIEDPIEYLYTDKRGLVTQRELGRDTHSFAIATRQALRQDPDVILVGEMRDPDTMAACLTAAETGHLVLSTLHTNSASQTIDRIVDSFPTHQQGQIRMQLSMTLLAVLAQALLPKLDRSGRVPALEIMLASPAIRNLIRDGKTHQMTGVVQTSSAAGMQTMEQALARLCQAGEIDLDTAQSYANDPAALQTFLRAG